MLSAPQSIFGKEALSNVSESNDGADHISPIGLDRRRTVIDGDKVVIAGNEKRWLGELNDGPLAKSAANWIFHHRDPVLFNQLENQFNGNTFGFRRFPPGQCFRNVV